mmetsp:Transcript_105681/g.298688  ORF Transcript_105681/g.298688 Transcript_105681/m.298688 type:complete len:436 (+) Transcript_105681:241-1548(+)
MFCLAAAQAVWTPRPGLSAAVQDPVLWTKRQRGRQLCQIRRIRQIRQIWQGCQSSQSSQTSSATRRAIMLCETTAADLGPILPLLPLAVAKDVPAVEQAPQPAKAAPAPGPLALSTAQDSHDTGSGALERQGKWASLSLTCVELDDWTEVCNVLPEHGSDFFVSSVACARFDDVADRLLTMRVEEHLVTEVFTHCYIAKSEDLKADVNAVIDDFGLGLRRARSMSAPGRGFVLVLVSEGAPSLLYMKHSEYEAHDKKLSTEERVRRTQLHFEASNMTTISQQARRNQGSFCLTCYTGVDLETCKRRVVTMEMDGVPINERFSRCLIVETRNCQEATNLINTQAGTGCKKSKVKSKPAPGCVVLLLPGGAHSIHASGLLAISDGSTLSSPGSKRKREDGMPRTGAPPGSVATTPPRTAAAATRPRFQRAGGEGVRK